MKENVSILYAMLLKDFHAVNTANVLTNGAKSHDTLLKWKILIVKIWRINDNFLKKVMDPKFIYTLQVLEVDLFSFLSEILLELLSCWIFKDGINSDFAHLKRSHDIIPHILSLM